MVRYFDLEMGEKRTLLSTKVISAFVAKWQTSLQKLQKNLLTEIRKVLLWEKVSLDGKSKQYFPLTHRFACWMRFPGKVLFRTVSLNQPENAA